MTDNNGDVLSPLPGAPGHETDMLRLPEGLNAVKKGAKMVGVVLTGAYLNLDAGCDSKQTRTRMFNAGMIPHIPENPRHRKRPKRGRKRFFNAAIHALRTRVDRTCAWEDQFKRLLLRFEHRQPRHFGMQWLAYTLINVREFCSV
jgi:transposase